MIEPAHDGKGGKCRRRGIRRRKEGEEGEKEGPHSNGSLDCGSGGKSGAASHKQQRRRRRSRAQGKWGSVGKRLRAALSEGREQVKEALADDETEASSLEVWRRALTLQQHTAVEEMNLLMADGAEEDGEGRETDEGEQRAREARPGRQTMLRKLGKQGGPTLDPFTLQVRPCMPHVAVPCR